MARVEHVEQGALELEARGVDVLPVEVFAQGGLQRVQVSQAQTLGQGVVGLGDLWRADLLHRRLERGRLPLQALDLVVVRESHLDRELVAGLRRRPAGSSKPGMNWPEPSTSSASVAVPPSKASPSMRPTKSITT